MRRSPFLLAALLTTVGTLASAEPPPSSNRPADTVAFPEWDRLAPAQREALIGPLRDRWNQNVDGRARMYDRAQRWRTMTPEQRAHARRGMQRFDRMDPGQRERSRALFDKIQALPPEQRKVLRDRLNAMSPDERRDWLRRNATSEGPLVAP